MIDWPDDDEFPLGDGTADSGATVSCPYCGAVNEIALDAGSGAEQDYVQDCEICCRPWRLRVLFGPEGHAQVSAELLE
ncbi:MAG TPA: CPXCG motif-containing cysteine-rich protein [Gemmatimonadales bacterium]|nr:CPXCG motif-containing cysteine-rich protein [Gemmatimonadales bacterium]